MKKPCQQNPFCAPRESGQSAESVRGMTPTEFCAFARAKGCEFTLDESEEILWALYQRTTESPVSRHTPAHAFVGSK